MRNLTSNGMRPRLRPFAAVSSDSTPRTRALAAIVLSCGLIQAGWAGDLTVHVSKRGAGHPVEAAAVCLGTPADIAQFGARLADEKGTVRFDKVHNRAELVLTVSKSGFKGRQVSLGAAGRDRGVLLTLAAGGGGPECAKALSVSRAVESSRSPVAGAFPSVTDFRINGGQEATSNPRVTLSFDLSGEASHYRASTRSDFQAAEWQPIETNVDYDLTGGRGLKTVYFQVGNIRSADGAEIEMLSNVAVDTIRLSGG